MGSVATGIWDVSHLPQISPTHASGHPSPGTARRLFVSHLHSAHIFLGQSKRNGPLTGGTTVICRQIFLQCHLHSCTVLSKDLKTPSSKKGRPAASIFITQRFHKVTCV